MHITPTRLLFALVALSAALTSGCVPMWTGDQMRQDIDALEARQQAMNENLSAEKTRLTEMIASAREDVTELKSVLKEAKALLQRNNADLGVEIQKTREELSHLRGEIEQIDFKLTKLDQDLELFKEDVDLRFSGQGVQSDLPEEAVPLYQYAENALNQGKFRTSRKAFERFMGDYSTHGKAADAQYFLGLTYFKEGQWVSSVFEFQKIVEKHSKSARVDDATYHIGAALMEMGRCDQAKNWFQSVVDDYGNSDWVGDARQKINTIKSGKCS